MTGFDDREASFENKFKHDKEQEFKAVSRRNKMLGLWAANLLGIHGAEAEAYAKTVIAADFQHHSDQDLVDKLLGDFKQHSVDMSEHRLRKQMAELLQTAIAQVRTEA
jgi:hypothetical protein